MLWTRRDRMSTREANHHNVTIQQIIIIISKTKDATTIPITELMRSEFLTTSHQSQKGFGNLGTSKGLPLGNPLEAPIGTGCSVPISVQFIILPVPFDARGFLWEGKGLQVCRKLLLKCAFQCDLSIGKITQEIQRRETQTVRTQEK